LRLARFGTNQLVKPSKMSFPELWLLSREHAQDKRSKRLLEADLSALLQKESVLLWAKGPAGFGKSSLCKYLAHGWAKQSGFLKDELCVAYIPLGEAMRDVRKQTDVVVLELVLWCHGTKLLGTLTLDEVREFIATHASALFIFDGVDDGLLAADEPGKQ
jgi:hypothetical protein